MERDGAHRTRFHSGQQVLVPWPFDPLPSRARATIRVRVASGSDWSAWSPPSQLETGLLHHSDWAARFVSPPPGWDGGGRAPRMWHRFNLPRAVARARLYATALGVYEVRLNGKRVGQDILAPGWTSYHHRLRYQTYDVTPLLRRGPNTIEAVIGDGWYRGRLGWEPGQFDPYGDKLAFVAQMEALLAGGETLIVATGPGWLVTASNVVSNSLYDGQRTDLRAPSPAEQPAEVLDLGLERLVAQDAPPITATGTRAPRSVWSTPSGSVLADFGQNLVGWVRVQVPRGREGDEVVVRHAETLLNGDLDARTLRTAEASESYVLPDSEDLVLEPSLTLHGFRYAEVSGTAPVDPHRIEAVLVGSNLGRIGWFRCSDPMLQQLHDNAEWSIRSNLVGVPTDCPQRDERLGWTADAALYAPAASFLFDTASMYSSWLRDLAADQYPDGTVPLFVPKAPAAGSPHHPPAACWGDAAAVVPWVIYERFGDPEVLDAQFESMRAWVDRVVSLTSDGIWAGGFQYGDWQDPLAPPEGRTDPDLLATAALVRSARLVATAARVLGRPSEARHYGKLVASTRRALADRFVTPAGRMTSDTPTAYAAAVAWSLLPTRRARIHAAGRLADLVRTGGFRATTGYFGTSLILDALTSGGHSLVACRMLLEKGFPSWLYPLSVGATSMWEQWDSVLPDGRLNIERSPSLNHAALASVVDWMHRSLAGLAPAAPGYRRVAVRPVVTPWLTEASARHETPYGEVETGWHRKDGWLRSTLTLPPGVTATVKLPGTEQVTVGPGSHQWSVPDPWRHPAPPPSTVRELLDEPKLWTDAVEILVNSGLATDDIDAARQAGRHLDTPAESLPARLAAGKFRRDSHNAASAFAHLLSGRRGDAETPRRQ